MWTDDGGKVQIEEGGTGARGCRSNDGDEVRVSRNENDRGGGEREDK